MDYLRKLSWLDIALIIILVAGAVITRSQFQAKSNLEEEKIRFETRARADEVTISQTEQEFNLDSLHQSLQQAQSALTENPLPSEADAIAVTKQIMQFALENNVIITNWDSSYISVEQETRKYSAISHSLSVEGKEDALISFMRALLRASIPPVVQDIAITAVGGKEDLWQMNLEPRVYYHQAELKS